LNHGFGGGDFERPSSGGFRDRDANGSRNNFGGGSNWADNASRGAGNVNRSHLNSFLGLPTDGGLAATRGALSNRGGTAERVDSAYGTHPFSQTWAHSQGHNVQNWAQNHPNSSSWAANHSWAWSPVGYDAGLWGAGLWTAATWPMLGDWLGWGDTDAYPYDYGNGITYQGDDVYYGSQPAGTTDQYYEEASHVASNAPTPSSTAQWLPLGVFGLVHGSNDQPNITFQIAVDKQGIVRGNSIEIGSTTAKPIQGAVQKKTQRLCWTIGSDTTTVYDTGLDNLTKSEAPILVHTGPKFTQQELLVRMKRPTQSGKDNETLGAN
jgi:hypothetical protein